MFNVIDKLIVGNVYCFSIEGETYFLKNGLKLIDENENIFIIESVGMPHYNNITDDRKYAQVILKGDVENIGNTLSYYI